MNTTHTGPAPLAGVRVLDLSKILAGPYATMSLADLGADVTKVEHPDGGDPTRSWGPPFVGVDATYYLAINRGKKSVTVDLKSEEGQDLIHRILEDTDVVVENFKPGSGLQRIFDYRTLSERYPHLVVLHISAFGEEGPLRDEPGYDMIAQAAGGLMSLTGEPGGAPMKAGFAMGDLGAALFGLVGVLAALVERSRTGRGQYVTTSLFECQLALHVNWATNYFATGERPGALGSGHPNLAPYQAFPASDGYFVVAVGNDTQWASLCSAIARDDLTADPRFERNRDRVANRGDLERELSTAFASGTVEQWCDTLTAHAVPVSPIRHLDEIYADPHTAALGMIGTVDHPTIGSLRQIAFPVSFAGERPHLTSAPPVLGADTDAVLGAHRPKSVVGG
ncbi:CaiB/BaiF CoA transferase family protein [Rhodococcus koreensis]|uniref:Crotonobetainyl-CoA:carnitine CoA-transferase CaiB n=1 Tax=Rhodococcus koreensis TaxID=99653 RepID=A0A1H4X695_9NOCA|nr:CoA transferase [Rhodococcus koreensis]SED00244.1 Crotonobetainyl-CoA:carnitine CoA-transferase CaiB [Rhodococcus koreensis]